MESQFQSRLPFTAPRLRSEQPAIAPRASSSYNIDLFRPNNSFAPGLSHHSAPLTGDAETGAVVRSGCRRLLEIRISS